MQSNLRKGLTVGVIFGGRSGEHEVSVITAHQVMEVLKVARHKPLPIYVTKDGAWYAGEPLFNLKAYSQKGFDPASLEGVHRVSLSPDCGTRELIVHPGTKRGLFSKPPKVWADVFFPAIHGTFGEDGTLQGLLELADVPYVGANVLASAVAMDKGVSKSICRDVGIPVLPALAISREEWKQEQAKCLQRLQQTFAFPLIVKPISLGSSIGVKRCKDEAELREGLETALVLDRRAIIEPALEDFIEINCAVLGPPAIASVCEQPRPSKDVLSFDDKYKRGRKGTKGAKGSQSGGMASLDRIIPAPISPELTKQVQEYAVRAFRATDSSGVARIDFLYDNKKQELYLNELNNPPGSFAFYLWEHGGMPFDVLVEKLLEIAFARHELKRETMFSYTANLLQANS